MHDYCNLYAHALVLPVMLCVVDVETVFDQNLLCNVTSGLWVHVALKTQH